VGPLPSQIIVIILSLHIVIIWSSYHCCIIVILLSYGHHIVVEYCCRMVIILLSYCCSVFTKVLQRYYTWDTLSLFTTALPNNCYIVIIIIVVISSSSLNCASLSYCHIIIVTVLYHFKLIVVYSPILHRGRVLSHCRLFSLYGRRILVAVLSSYCRRMVVLLLVYRCHIVVVWSSYHR